MFLLGLLVSDTPLPSSEFAISATVSSCRKYSWEDNRQHSPVDYAAPEVLRGQQYRGKEQDVWALGILLYTIVYKENPFYSIDEIMDHDLRVPYVMSEESIDLIRCMLNRDVEKRWTISQVLDHPWCKEEERSDA